MDSQAKIRELEVRIQKLEEFVKEFKEVSEVITAIIQVIMER